MSPFTSKLAHKTLDLLGPVGLSSQHILLPSRSIPAGLSVLEVKREQSDLSFMGGMVMLERSHLVMSPDPPTISVMYKVGSWPLPLDFRVMPKASENPLNKDSSLEPSRLERYISVPLPPFFSTQ